MSGHSKWSTIKRKKGKEDAKRGKLFTKAIKEIQIAARQGGGDPSGNPRLRTAIINARAVNMPSDNIERAIKKGTGELEGTNYEEGTFEGYGPGGSAIFIETLSDNRNRTVGEIRHLFTKYGGSMGESGCVAWIFKKSGVISVDAEKANEEQVIEVALEAGADDVTNEDGTIEVLCDQGLVSEVKEALEKAGIPVDSAEVSMIPSNTVSLSGKEAQSCMKLIDLFDNNDDVQNVYSNADISEEAIAEL
jgi:YebC/PmpR family DNA-binding regulatory protein